MPRPHALRAALLLCMLGALLLPAAADAQSWKDRLKQAAARGATEAATRRAEGAARSGTEKSIDAAVGAVAGRVGANGDTADAASAPAAAATTAGATPAAPGGTAGVGAWANYDFVPGSRVLFADDFGGETVGDFPRRLEYVDGASEIVEWDGRRWIASGGAGAFTIPLPEVLPERFTMEFELAGRGNAMEVMFDGTSTRHTKTAGNDHVRFGTWFAGVAGNGREATVATGHKTEDAPVKARIMVDGAYVKVFVNEKRVANVPNAKLGRSNKILVFLNGWSEEAPRLVGDVRVMAGGRALYDALAERGRVATQGIYFDTGSDRLRPESSGTLKEIATMLREHPDLRLTIEGHTDGAGDAAANQALSERRAAAVKASLVASFGVGADRLETQGFGASKPATSNATPDGRAANRRVELVKR